MDNQIRSIEKAEPYAQYEIGSVTVPVPFRKPGNVVEHLSVQFDVFQKGPELEAYPVISEADKRLTNLPASIGIQWKEERAADTRYFSIASDILQQLKRTNL